MPESAEGDEVLPHLQAELARALQVLGISGEHPRDGPGSGATAASCSSGPEGPGMLLPGNELDRFMILRRIGGGGQGDVYAAYDPRLDRRVALKLIRLGTSAGDEVQNARLLREAQALARLEHPNVVRIHDTGSHAAAAFLVMEFIRSPTLSRWLHDGSRRWREILEKFHAAGRGLRAAHARGIVHRDVKADNIFVDDQVGALLGDFGLALGVGDAVGESEPDMHIAGPRPSALRQPLTARDQFLGTEGYVAPEAMRGRATALSDQYSFCVAVFHALFGIMARPDEDRWPTRPRDRVPRGVVKVLHRGLSRDPAARFPDMGALLAALPMRPGRRLALFAGAGLVAAIAGASFATWRNPTVCQDTARAELGAVWNEERDAAVRSGFSQVSLPFTERTRDSFIKLADAYALHWSEERTAACANDLRETTECLAGQLDRLDKLLANYRAPDARRIEHALDALTALDLPSRCRAAGPRDVAMPDDLRDGLDAVEAWILSGDYPNARLALSAIRAAAATDPAAEARALYLAGWLAAATAPDRTSDELLAQAMRAASKVQDADTFARAAIYRLNSLVNDLGALREAAVLEEVIENTSSWWPADVSIHERFAADIAEARGGRLDADGDSEQAIAALQDALALRSARDGDDHPRLAKAHHNLAVALAGDPARHDEAHRNYIKAYHIRANWYGDDHPYTLESEFGLAQFECEDLTPPIQGRRGVAPDCVAELEENLIDYRTRYAPDPRGIHRRRVTLANLNVLLGRFDEAESLLGSTEAAMAAVPDVDVLEQSDLLAVRGKLAERLDDFHAERIAYMASFEALDVAGRRDSTYFARMLQATRAAVKEWRGDLAVELLLQHRGDALGGDCSVRLAYAGVVEDLMESLAEGPDRSLNDLELAATLTSHGCVTTETAGSESS